MACKSRPSFPSTIPYMIDHRGIDPCLFLALQASPPGLQKAPSEVAPAGIAGGTLVSCARMTASFLFLSTSLFLTILLAKVFVHSPYASLTKIYDPSDINHGSSRNPPVPGPPPCKQTAAPRTSLLPNQLTRAQDITQYLTSSLCIQSKFPSRPHNPAPRQLMSRG